MIYALRLLQPSRAYPSTHLPIKIGQTGRGKARLREHARELPEFEVLLAQETKFRHCVEANVQVLLGNHLIGNTWDWYDVGVAMALLAIELATADAIKNNGTWWPLVRHGDPRSFPRS